VSKITVGTVRGVERAGFTLVELLIALTVFGAIIAASLGFMSVQNRALNEGLDRMTGLQTARFAMEILEHDISTAGTNVPAGQPQLVMAGTDVISFSADYVTNVPRNPFAIFYDPDAPTGQVTMTQTKTVLPNSSFQYPDTAYMAGPVISPAELITFFFRADSSTVRTDDYALFRKVNVGTPELVANNLLVPTVNPFFRYFTTVANKIDSVPAAQLPLRHTLRNHKSPADTGAVSRVDSVRAVRITLRATNGLSGPNEETAEITRIVMMPNVQIQMVEACGSDPILGQALSAADTTNALGERQIRLRWGAATDEIAGEKDVMRYVVWRRQPPAATWEEPYLSVPAGEAGNYLFIDADVVSGQTYQYGLAAQDCTPSLSPITASVLVTLP
jgi:prepilin-type N-terminal cleavage/methylation domain-containing protein